MSVEIRRGGERFTERVSGRLSQHSFSFGSHYDPERLSFGPMVCHDDHLLGRGLGFDTHPHENLEIITWVVSGSVRHTDDRGFVELPAGWCGVLSAGTGVQHSELASAQGPARFVQVWLTPDLPAAAPRYEHAQIAPTPGQGLVRAVGDGGPLAVGVGRAALDVVHLDAGETLTLPGAARVHAFVVSGALLRFSLAEPLSAGDALLLSPERSHGPDGPGGSGGSGPGAYDVTAAVPTQLLVWSFA
ncbi:MAG: pirin family protein [Nocardioidaceae bacterium]|nr:pirin family protein [Nocardioidaceae bacterium]